MIKLRSGYQVPWVNSVQEALATHRTVLGAMPTGGGKTRCFSWLMSQHVGACSAVVHRKELVSQISMALAELGVMHRVVAPPPVITRIRRKQLKVLKRSYVDDQAPVGVMSVQSLTSKSAAKDSGLQRWLKQITFNVFDEGHHYVQKGLWGRAFDALPNAKHLLVTATPRRADGIGLGSHAGGFADVMVEGPTTRWLMQEGYLSGYRYVCPGTDLNTEDLPRNSKGEIDTNAMRSRIKESHFVGNIVDHYLTYARVKKTIVFANDVKTAVETCAEFTSRGVRAVALSGDTDGGERDRALGQFEEGEIDVLINVDLFDEGFDVPAVECVILGRLTESLAKYLQMCGRAFRPVYAPGFDLDTKEGRLAAMAAGPKPKALIIDPVRNWERNGGLPNMPRVWSLDSIDKNARGGAQDLVPQYICRECTQPYEKFYANCPHCGALPPEPAGRSAPEQVGGDLYELDVEALAALFDDIARADMSDADYAKDQIARGIPPIGRRQDMKRHQDAVYRRGVLRNLVGWWVGCHPDGRDMPEIHRRFYYRFGIDIGTAFTLNAKDTDALIARIQQRFDEDILE